MSPRSYPSEHCLRSEGRNRNAAHSYTYRGLDFPFIHPDIHFGPAALMLQETIRYSHNTSDSVAQLEWETLNQRSANFGRAILGPDKRSFLMTFHHQLHCVRELQRALIDPSNDHNASTPHHVNHCLQYLRQTILCGAADSIEMGDFMEIDFEIERSGSELRCVDWESAFRELGMDGENLSSGEIVGTSNATSGYTAMYGTDSGSAAY
ncbi:hypothetical protein D9757_006880 [Collybiopsis confluens]|uniref:Uncharacterized protein n=1 Tax=Collybiopsis confluens TaxID=2823264 RepID=A0A8H5HPQ9_9AGAR|nr:hypothetical protein D9757_006880 [Collybiopsis confluens]